LLDPHGDMNKVYPLPANDSTFKITYPVAQFDHNQGTTAIAGGYEYQGKAVPELEGKYVFGDIPSGRLFYIDIADIKQGKQSTIKEWRISKNGTPGTFKNFYGDQRVDLHFGRDSQG